MQLRFTFLALIVAIVASVFAIWPVVADAPWEEGAVIVMEAQAETPDPRCEAARIMRAEARVARAALPGRSISKADLAELIEEADIDIRRYC